MKRLLAGLFAVGLLLPGLGALAQSGALPDALPKVKASFVPERPAVAPGGTVTVALNQVIRKNWHTYWINPGDSGAPTVISWHLPKGWSAGEIQWPYPERLPVGPLMNFGYDDKVSLLVDVTAPKEARIGETVTLAADVMWLVCSDVCVPEETQLSVPLTVAASPLPPDPLTAGAFAAARSKLPHPSPWPAVYDAGDKRFALLVESPELAAAKPKRAEFFPYADGEMEFAAPQAVGVSGSGLVIESTTGYKLAKPENRAHAGNVAGLLVLTGADGRVDALSVEAKPGTVPPGAVTSPGAAPIGLLEAVLFALVGGLILNLMPCVFPVLSMKVLALAKKRERPEEARSAAMAYAAGILVSFLALAGFLMALRAGGAAVGWGFQLQQPAFVMALALVMFALGLNLSGLYEIGAGGLTGMGGSLAGKAGPLGSFFTGILAVVVATPCTAPFMAAALGFALATNLTTALAVFLALGAGFALPFLALGFYPRALGFLPRPGAWMTTLRQGLAFPMYGAAIWLVWVLSLEAGASAVLGALSGGLVLAFGLWLYGREQGGPTARLAGLGAAALALAGAIALLPAARPGVAVAASSAVPPAGGEALAYEPFSAAKLAALRAEGRPVFVNATAAWCISCLVNEKVALSGRHLAEVFSQRKVAALRADWTNQDAEVTALLQSQGRSGVPLYLYFAPDAQAPVILPQLLTEATVIAAVTGSR